MWIRSIFFLQKHKIYIFLKVYMVGLTVDYGFLITMHKNDKMKTFAVKVVWVLRQQTISASQYATIYDSLCAARVSLWVSLHASCSCVLTVAGISGFHGWMHTFTCTEAWACTVPVQGVRAEQILECSLAFMSELCTLCVHSGSGPI